MVNNLSTFAETFDDLKSELVISLELQRGEGCDIEAIRATGNRLAESIKPLLNATAVPADSDEEFERNFKSVEATYRDWKSITAAMTETTTLAYNATVPRSNLLVADIHSDLKERVGEPISARYAQMCEQWRVHVESRPWDAYLNKTPKHLDAQQLDDSLAALVRGDDLDVEDAVRDLTGDLRYAFADFLSAHPNELDDMEVGLWKRPEYIVAGDFWRRGNRMKLIDVFKKHGSRRFTAAMNILDNLFTPSETGAAGVVGKLQEAPEAYRERLTRCLMLHPDNAVRRYAASNVDDNSIWKVLTPENIPCATILSSLEHVIGSRQFTTTHRKIFFDTVYRRLLSVSSRSDVLYARGIVRIFSKLSFFLEDFYFARLLNLLDYLETQEKIHKIDDSTMRDYISELRDQKDKVGTNPGQEPDFTGVPMVILRKIARDGHFWNLLSTHPIVKISRETIPHINSRDRAFKAASNHVINPEVLRTIGRNRALFSTLQSKMELLGNPRTPPLTSMEYVPDMTRRDIEQLLRRGGIHPELRSRLRNRYDSWKR